MTRILVVDDFEPFRRFLTSTVEQAGLHVIGEASDGRVAVQRADTLRPDLILLDIGLPSLGGLEAAREIRTLVSHSRILIVSQELSPAIVQAALDLGARGYVLKSDTGRELLIAIKAVLRGEVYVSRSLMRHGSTYPVKGHQPAVLSRLG
jgi:DNA-binding NarL/FixJ family response regulator